MSRAAEIGRFLAVGVANTGLSLALFVALAEVLDPRAAYAIAFAAGIAFTAVASSRFVFRSRTGSRGVWLFVGWYLVVFAVGELTVHRVAVDAGRPAWQAGLATAAITAPLNYIGGRLTLVGRAARRSD